MVVGILSLLFFTITLSIKEGRNWVNRFIRVKKESHVVLYGIIMCVFISLATYLSHSHIKAQARHIESVKSEVNRLGKTGDSHFESKEYDLAKDNYLKAFEKAKELPGEYTKEFLTNINNGLKELDLKKEELASIRAAEERRRQKEETTPAQIIWNKCVEAVIALKTYRWEEHLKTGGGLKIWSYGKTDYPKKRSQIWDRSPDGAINMGENSYIGEEEYYRSEPYDIWSFSGIRPEIWKQSYKTENICGAFNPINITLLNGKEIFNGHECWVLRFHAKSEYEDAQCTLWIDKGNNLPYKRIKEGKVMSWPNAILETFYYDFNKPLNMTKFGD